MPSQNTGTETRIDVLRVTSMSQNEYFLTAESIPAARPMIDSMISATSASLSVFGNFSNRMVVDRTLLLVRISQIAVHQMIQVPPVLDVEGLVQRVLLDDLLVQSRGDGSLPRDHANRVAGDDGR